MGNKRYDKLKASFEATQPQLPSDFTDRVMKRMESGRHRSISMKRAVIAVLAVAACIALVVLLVRPHQSEPAKPLVATTHVARSPRPTHIETAEPRSSKPSTHVARPVRPRRTKNPLPTDQESAPVVQIADPNLHYAAQIQTEDTVPYQAPSRVDEFIAKLAEYDKVKAVPLNCSSDIGPDTTIVSTAYLFEDKPEIDLFAKLLQVACWYDTKTPGYLLNFSRQQFIFCLKDLRKGQKYLWVAERIGNRYILLYSTHSPLETEVSSACFQEYREQLMHKGINIINS